MIPIAKMKPAMNPTNAASFSGLHADIQATLDDHYTTLTAAGSEGHSPGDGPHRRKFTLTYARLAVLRALEMEPQQALCREDVFRLMQSSGMNISIASVYRIINELTSAGILLREWNDGHKALYRIKPRDFDQQELRMKSGGKNADVAVDDTGLLIRILSVARQQGFDAPWKRITIVLD